MRRVLNIIFFTILLNVIFIININAEEIKINSKNAIMYNELDNKIIYEKNKDEKIKIASLTKIATIIIALENGDLNKEIIITNEDFNNTADLALAGFKVGEKVTLEDLLYGAMLPSGAEACNTLARSTSGSVENHVKKMNELAKKLNCKNTHFVNVTGIDANNHDSSVSDLSKILKYALENNNFRKIFETKEHKVNENLIFKRTLNSVAKKNNLDVSFIKGAKTGHTDDAGVCLASTTTLNKVPYLLVTCDKYGSNDNPTHIKDASILYNYFSENYNYVDVIKKGDIIKKVKIKDGKKKFYNITSPETVNKYIKKDSKIDIKFIGIKEINPKIKKGDFLGTVSIYINNKKEKEIKLYLKDKIKYKFLTKRNIVTSLILLILLLILLFIIRKIKIISFQK